ncbi:hypothetical protein BZZ01_01055 [Nostocales cyanobacterium HT-58-2]|nr:hypothetical protein BZZ01_01055 [Nostocales cyanobacterium HT-58-2]
MKNISKIARRLMLVFMAFVASSMMFLSSPAVAATSSVTLLTPDNFETEVVKSDKPVVVVLASIPTLEGYNTSLEKLKSDAENYFGDKYKVVVGKAEENADNYQLFVPSPLIYPPLSTIIGLKNGQRVTGAVFRPGNSTSAFEYVKGQLG